MAISPVSKTQPMREGEIAAIDALNLAIGKLNAMPKLLYQSSIDGTFSEGQTKNIPNLNDYCLFAVKPTTGDLFCLVFCPNNINSNWTSFRGTGGTISDAPNIFTYTLRATKNGNNLTLIKFGSINVSGTSVTTYGIEAIYGIL